MCPTSHKETVGKVLKYIESYWSKAILMCLNDRPIGINLIGDHLLQLQKYAISITHSTNVPVISLEKLT